MREVEVREDGIRLGQLLKLADLVDQGSDVRPLLGEEVVAVNVAGGMVAWQRAGLPMESSTGAPPAVV